MATVTKPIALDESLHTTELTPRNLADVLAEEIKALTTVVGGLNFINCVVVPSLPTTGISTTTIYLVPKSPAQQDNVYDEYINLDGTVNGWEKIGDTEIDLSNYYTKTQTDTLLNGKVDTVAGMGLSHNDYTDAEKAKLGGIESGAEVNVQSDWSQADSSADDYIKNKPSNLVSDASYVHTDNNFTNAEKTKLSGIESGAEVNVQSDWNQTDNTKDDYIKNKPSSEVKTATDTFTTVNGGLLEECNIELVPVQDLHGYSEPWVGGSRKNKLPLVLADIKSLNLAGTWNGNVYIYRDVAYTVLTDSSDNVIAIKVNNTATADGTFHIPFGGISVGDYYGNGCPDGGSNSTFDVYFWNSTTNARAKKWDGTTNSVSLYDSTSSEEIQVPNATDDLRYVIRIRSGYTANNLMFYPMIRLGTESDATFEPYSNICPISGHTEVDLQRDGKNLFPNAVTNGSHNGITRTVNPDGSISLSGTASANEFIAIFENGFLPAGSYTLKGTGKVGVEVHIRQENIAGATIVSTNGNDASITLNRDYVTAGIIRVVSGTNTDGVTLYLQLEKGNQATSYEPYLGHLYQVQIGSIVYGGYVDLVSGVMTVDRVIFEHLENINFSYASTATVPFFDSAPTFTPDIDLNKLSLSICSDYKFNMIAMTGSDDGTFYITASKHIRFCNLSYTDVNTFKASLAGVKLVYYVATPFTIQLTPQQIEALVGQNNLSCPLSGQSIDSVKYREVFVFDDVEKVVSLRVPISMLGTDESGNSTASQAYASGDYFYKDGYMCKALTSISAGATLTLNTNYSQGTLADILKAIENA